jgi:predicted nicotinamide N-methyase
MQRIWFRDDSKNAYKPGSEIRMPFSLEQFRQDYDTESFPVRIGQHELHFLKPKAIDRFIDPDDPMTEFPMWAKFWEASVVLTHYMAGLPVAADRRILELGSGLGVAGIVAAVIGHAITLTEHNPDALNFLRANTGLNGCDRTAIHHLDWFHPDLKGRFDLIIGSEIVYQDSAVEAFGSLFKKHLAPQGRVVLAERIRTTKTLFFEYMSSSFDIRAKKHTLRSKEKTDTVILFELKAK